MPPNYPDQASAKYELSAPWMDRKSKEALHEALDQVSLQNAGGATIYQWAEKIREIVRVLERKSEKRTTTKKPTKCNGGDAATAHTCPPITHAAVITDRRSNFQGHAAQVHSVADVEAVLKELKLNSKIQNAKHNVFAYRILVDGKLLEHDDNDGERKAGGRLLHYLKIRDLQNVVVVVTRWFGGIMLGADRFKHYTEAAKQAVESAGLDRPTAPKLTSKSRRR
ncbi:protein IMPACT isoform X2 [Amyelois transitella]|nr:protein IMPACT isoform X2 [Amyelois transitella]